MQDEVSANVRKRMTGLIREVSMRGVEGRWQLRFGLEDAVKYAEFMLRPLPQGPQSDTTLRRGIACVIKAYGDAMEDVFPDVREREAMRERMGSWFKASHEVGSHEIEDYLNAIASTMVRRKVA